MEHEDAPATGIVIVHQRRHLCRASQQSWDHMAGWFVIAGFIFFGLLVLQVEQRARRVR
jgi:uncharacterized membrane protein